MSKMRKAVSAAAVFAALNPRVASAAPADALLTGANGSGSYDPALPCGQGDGPSWSYQWHEQPSVSIGRLGGVWNGSFEVHEASLGKAFIPVGDGRIAITSDAGGVAHFESGSTGSCVLPTLDLGIEDGGDPQVSGTVPLTATGGTGALKGLTGSGSAVVSLELGGGADNDASISLSGNFDVTNPALTVSGASARWNSLSDYLAKKLTVTVTVVNSAAGGSAFATTLASVTGGTGSFSGVPTAVGAPQVAPGSATSFTFVMNGAGANKTYTLAATPTARDAFDEVTTGPAGSVTFKSPLLP